MHAFLVSQNPLINDNPDVLHIRPENSIGIEEIRTVTTFLSRQPIQSAHNTVIVHQAHLLTLPAQNAFLKTLEEPPANSQIYLVTDFPHQLLPTILSRVQLIESFLSPEEKDTSTAEELLRRFLAVGIGERLELIDRQEYTRETALQFLSDLELVIHRDLSLSRIYPLVCSFRKYLVGNVNVRLVMDHFAIGLGQIHPASPGQN
jgi:DNA polymerase III delta prime subunit